jgi:E3 ubiquitin ligase
VTVAHPPPYPLIALAAGALALLALYRFLVRLRRDRLVADTPVARLRSAAQGYVKVFGRAEPAGPAPTAAPLSARPCVWWAFEIAEEQRDSKGNVRWHTIESAASVEPFALVDEQDNRCLVGPVAAEVTPSTRNVWYGAEPRPTLPPPDITPLLHTGGYRYTERLLGVGAQLCVMGELRSRSQTGDLNAAVAAKLHGWKQDEPRLLARFDADHDGRLSAAEWDAARAEALREAQADALSSHIERVSMISEPTNGEPFLIAPMSGAALERRERLFAGLYFVLGLLGVIACAWALRHSGLT